MIKIRGKYIFLVLFLMLLSVRVSSQLIGKPKLGYEYACAKKDVFNTYNISVPINGYSSANNYFILELSDPNGSFEDKTKVIELKRIKQASGSSVEFSFPFPKEVFGEAYKVRVRSTEPQKESAKSKAFAAYFLPPGRPILNNREFKVFLCGGNAKREVEITFEDKTIDPSIYKYTWFKNDKVYKEAGNTNKIFITEKGFYKAQILLQKACANIDASNRIQAIEINSKKEVYLNDKQNEVELCLNQSYTFKANVSDPLNKYFWYKDGELIKGSNEKQSEFITEKTNQYGVYHLEVLEPKGCRIESQKITLKKREASFKVTIEGDSIRGVTPDKPIELKLNVSKANASYTYQWYKDDQPIVDETDSVLSVSELGLYFVKVTDVSLEDCPFSVNSSIVKVEKENLATVVPNILTPFNADGVNDLWVIPKEYAGNSGVKVIIYDTAGKEIFSKLNYQNDWPEANSVKAGMLYYFRILVEGNIKKSGTISILE